jgi:hypothetical protein
VKSNNVARAAGSEAASARSVQKQLHFCLPDVRYVPKSMPVSAFVLHYGVVVEERKQRSMVNDGWTLSTGTCTRLLRKI